MAEPVTPAETPAPAPPPPAPAPAPPPPPAPAAKVNGPARKPHEIEADGGLSPFRVTGPPAGAIVPRSKELLDALGG